MHPVICITQPSCTSSTIAVYYSCQCVCVWVYVCVCQRERERERERVSERGSVCWWCVTSCRRSTPSGERRGAWWLGHSRTVPAAFAWPDDSCWTRQCSGRGTQTPWRHRQHSLKNEVEENLLNLFILFLMVWFMWKYSILIHTNPVNKSIKQLFNLSICFLQRKHNIKYTFMNTLKLYLSISVHHRISSLLSMKTGKCSSFPCFTELERVVIVRNFSNWN